MKKTVQLLILLFSGMVFAQIPAYYSDIDLTQTGSALQSSLTNKVTNTQTTSLSYTPGVWDALKQSDLNPANSNEVLLVYGYNDNDGNNKTDRTRGKNDNGGGSGQWNREHVYPKSLGTPNLGTTGAGSDAHHLRPSDIQMNSDRSNRKFADGSGNASITSQGYFYPGDEWKGDVARMILFMYVRYENRCLPSNVGIGTTNSEDSNMINLFLEWNVEDPVSGFEDQRNDVIAGIQGNRNPFIDNPAFATQIWGGPQAEDRFGTGTGGGSAELFISEYVEGSSNNKAIEIANFTGESVNLSGYQLKKQTNGAGNWSAGYSLSSTLANGDVYVVANNSASSAVTSNANATTTNSALTFNGNDPVGLFKNNVLIDIIGNFNGGSGNFAKDKTWRRKTTVSGPNTSFSTSEWDIFNQNTFGDLGAHSVDGTGGGGNPPPSYCASNGNNSSFEYIDLVSLGGISNSSTSNGGYGDFTNQIANIGYGSNTVIFSAGFSGSSYTEFWKVWIDFNQNGTFESSEEVVTGSSASSGNLSSNFTVPSSALSGPTRMRVSMKWDAAQTSCESFSYGEVEDYTVNISSALAPITSFVENIEKTLNQESKVYSVQLIDHQSTVTIEMVDDRAISYKLYSTSGQLVSFGNFQKHLYIDALKTGLYILHLNDGQRIIQRKIIKK